MVLFGDLAYDSRVRREASALAEAGYRVRLACTEGLLDTPPLADGVDVVEIPVAASERGVIRDWARARLPARSHASIDRALWFTSYARRLRAWGQAAVRAVGPVDAWHAHDLTGLVAVAPVLGRSTPTVYDSHEIYVNASTAAKMPTPVRAAMRLYEGWLTARVAALVTVCDPFAWILSRRYRPARVIVVRNAPPRWTGPTDPADRLRAAMEVGPDARVVLYHGVFAPDRGLEELAAAMMRPPMWGVHLALLGFGPMRASLEALSAAPGSGGRIHVLAGVSPTDLLDWVHRADVAAMPIMPTTLSHRLTTPNKLYEALAAGVPVVVSDTPGMAPLIRDTPWGPLGESCNPAEPGDIAAAIGRILAMEAGAYRDLRARCARAAREAYNWESESAKLVGLYEDLLGPARPQSAQGVAEQRPSAVASSEQAALLSASSGPRV